MNSINGASHCAGKHGSPAPAQQVGAGAPTQGAYGGGPVQQTGGLPNNGSQANYPQGTQSQRLANTMNVSQQLNNGWQGKQDGATRVAVIDDFVTGNDGFNHGAEIDGIIRGGGATTSGAVQGGSNVETVQFNINNGGNRTQNIASSLDRIANLAAQGQRFDAVNISQQDFGNNADTAAVREKIDLLQRQFGIPVVVAAGNNAQGVRNSLAGSAAFVVENSTVGSDFRAANSGLGNVRSEGRFTSQSAANVTARVAQLNELGYSFAQIQQLLSTEAAREGGSLDGRGF